MTILSLSMILNDVFVSHVDDGLSRSHDHGRNGHDGHFGLCRGLGSHGRGRV